MEVGREKNYSLSKFTLLILGLYIFTAIIFYASPGLTIIPKAMGLLLVGMFVIELSTSKVKLYFDGTVKAIFLFCCISLLGLLMNLQAYNLFFTIFQLSILYLVIFIIFINDNRVSILENSILLGLSYVVFKQAMEGRNIFNIANETRVVAELGDQNDYGFTLSMGVALLIYKIIRILEDDRRFKFLYLIILIFGITVFSIENIAASGSRAGLMYLMILLMYGFYIFFNSVSLMFKVWIVGIFCSLSYFVITAVMGSAHFARLVTLFVFLMDPSYKVYNRSVDTSANERMRFIYDGWRLFKESPVIGHGLDNFRYINSVKETFSHNNYVEVLVNFGLIGFLVYYSVYIFFFYRVYILSRVGKLKNSIKWLVAIAVCLLFRDIVHVNYYNKIQIMMIAFILGVITCEYRKYVFPVKRTIK